jgi:hypothetical protein
LKLLVIAVPFGQSTAVDACAHWDGYGVWVLPGQRVESW